MVFLITNSHSSLSGLVAELFVEAETEKKR